MCRAEVGAFLRHTISVSLCNGAHLCGILRSHYQRESSVWLAWDVFPILSSKPIIHSFICSFIHSTRYWARDEGGSAHSPALEKFIVLIFSIFHILSIFHCSNKFITVESVARNMWPEELTINENIVSDMESKWCEGQGWKKRRSRNRKGKEGLFPLKIYSVSSYTTL